MFSDLVSPGTSIAGLSANTNLMEENMKKVTYVGTLITGTLLALTAMGCGKDDSIGFGECNDLKASFEACGGEVMGTWEVSGVCHNSPYNPYDQGGEECPNATATASITAACTATLDKTSIQYSKSNMTFIADMKVPIDCLTADDMNCAGYEQALEKQFEKEDDGNASCSEKDNICQCNVNMTVEDQPIEEPYRIENNKLITGEGEDQVSIPFCVKGNEMAMKIPNSEMGVEYVIYKK
jgi:hypothetical protein